MIKLDLKNAGIDKKDFQKNQKLIAPYLEKINSRKQGFYTVINNKKTAEEIEKFAKSIRGKYSHFVILGIGGSALGAACINQIFSEFYRHSKLIVLDNIDPILIKELDKILDYKKTLFLVITKSGTTPETISQYLYFRKRVENKKLDIKKHFVMLTDAKNGWLREVVKKERFTSFEIPENVGGRFSVLTSVGLLPAALLGLNIKNLLKGAQKMRDKFISKNAADNLPFKLALTQYLLYRKNKTINVFMPYSQKLYEFSNWLRQLYAESLGKKGKGITPVTALGVTDQHSQIQLYNEGPNDKLIIFFETENVGKTEIPNLPIDKKLSFEQLFEIEKESTKKALTKYRRPHISVKLAKIDEETLGELFMLFEGTVAFLGEFMEINAYDQPGVELAKSLTKQAILKL